MTDKALPQPVVDTIAGFVAGVASTLITHPLDLVKTRLQGRNPPRGSHTYRVEFTEKIQLIGTLHLSLAALSALYVRLLGTKVSSQDSIVVLRPTLSAIP